MHSFICFSNSFILHNNQYKKRKENANAFPNLYLASIILLNHPTKYPERYALDFWFKLSSVASASRRPLVAEPVLPSGVSLG